MYINVGYISLFVVLIPFSYASVVEISEKASYATDKDDKFSYRRYSSNL